MTNLYFIAILTPEKITKDIRHFQQQAANLFHSRRALRNPPHITLIPPFRFPRKKASAADFATARQRLQKRLTEFAERQDIRQILGHLHIELHDFGFFPPRVIFVRVKENPELNRLQAALQKATSDLTGFPPVPKRPFHPHLTIAYRDLDEALFPKARRHFEALRYRASFPAPQLTLLKHENGRWVS
ncbi:MAG TPA: 2'-5' RNA ligase family protein [Phaeodactylibacter sp.]|nr:2'-5' RNA ligase family protein [Phaeodactylibacter sp.]